MICSSVKRLRFILWSSQWARAYFKMDYFNGARSAGSGLLQRAGTDDGGGTIEAEIHLTRRPKLFKQTEPTLLVLGGNSRQVWELLLCLCHGPFQGPFDLIS